MPGRALEPIANQLAPVMHHDEIVQIEKIECGQTEGCGQRRLQDPLPLHQLC